MIRSWGGSRSRETQLAIRLASLTFFETRHCSAGNIRERARQPALEDI